MSELEYIRATNLAKLRIAADILKEVMPNADGDDHGISEAELKTALLIVSGVADELWATVTVSENKATDHSAADRIDPEAMLAMPESLRFYSEDDLEHMDFTDTPEPEADGCVVTAPKFDYKVEGWETKQP